MRAANPLKQADIKTNIDQSGLVTSSQAGVHVHLEKTVRRHLDTRWLEPLHRATVAVYEQFISTGIFSARNRFILDSGCGTGKSSKKLAGLFPCHMVIGVDRSRTRLAGNGMESGIFQHGNCILLRAELSTFWRLLLKDGFRPERHFLLYPNPWPKSGHFKRRWHGHPVFPQMLALGGEIELRCNWEIYAREFAQAVGVATGANIDTKKIKPEMAISPFERKYLEREQSLFSVTVPAQKTEAFRRSWISASLVQPV